METLECIKTRRSVRKFKTDSVSKETIEELVLAASYALHGKILRQQGTLL